MKTKFSRGVSSTDLRHGVHLGRFRWSAAAPRPSWDALKVAAVWVEPRFQNVREHLQQPHVAERKVTGDERLQSVQLAAAKRHATMFDGRAEDIPRSVAAENPRAIIVPLQAGQKFTASILQHMENTPTMLFGSKEAAKATMKELQEQKTGKIISKIKVYTRPSHHLPNAQRKLREKTIVLVSDPGTIVTQVPLSLPTCSLHCSWPHAPCAGACHDHPPSLQWTPPLRLVLSTCVVKTPVSVWAPCFHAHAHKYSTYTRTRITTQLHAHAYKMWPSSPPALRFSLSAPELLQLG